MAKSMKSILQDFIKELHIAATNNHDSTSAQRLAIISMRLTEPDVIISNSSQDLKSIKEFIALTKRELPESLFRHSNVQKKEIALEKQTETINMRRMRHMK